MATNDEYAQFGIEMKRHFEEFTAWAIANWPDKSAPLSNADFDIVRKKIASLADHNIDIAEHVAATPDPSESGPQYINVTPNPWP